ncbi:MAG: MFS transporter [Gordonia sp. (in: high G+C Gram-positive bacteria)]
MAVWTLVVGTGVSVLGNSALTTGVIWLVVTGYHDPGAAGLTLAVCSVVGIILSPLAGIILDRSRGILLMVVVDTVLFLVFAGLAGFIALHGASFTVLFVAMVSAAMGSTVSSPGLHMLLSRCIEPAERRETNAKLYSGARIGQIVGPLMGGGLLGIGGESGLIIFDALTFLTSAGAVTWVLRRERLVTTTGGGPVRRGGSRDAVTFILGSRVVLSIILLGAMVNTVTSGFGVVLPVLVDRASGSAASFGLIYGCYQAAMLFATILLGLKLISRFLRVKDVLAIGISLCVFSIGIFISVATNELPILALAVVAIGVGLSSTALVADTALVTSVPEPIQGTVFAVSNSILSMLRPLGSAGAGFLVGVSVLLTGTIAAGVGLLCAVLFACQRWEHVIGQEGS